MYYIDSFISALSMQVGKQLSQPTLLFVYKLQTYLNQNNISLQEFVNSLQPNNHNQLSHLNSQEVQRIIPIIHIETINFKQVVKELSHNTKNITLSDLKTIINVQGKDRNQSNEARKKVWKLIIDDRKQKMIKRYSQMLKKYIVQQSIQVAFFHSHDSNLNKSIDKDEFRKILVSTGIKQFVSNTARNMLTESIFNQFGKTEITTSEFYHYFNYEEKRQTNQLDIKHPLYLKYYKQSEDQPKEKEFIKQFQDLLNRNILFIDKQNPKIQQGSYVPAAKIFNCMYRIFQSDPSARQKDRIEIAQQIQPSDVIQGQLEDCYFLSSIASLISLHPKLIDQKFLLKENPANFYAIKLFINGQWKVFSTDDHFPCKGNTPIYAKPHNNELWVMLLQKVWAKEFGSYQTIKIGSSKEAFIALTGAPCEILSQQQLKGQSQAFKQLQNIQKNQYAATVSGSKQLKQLGQQGQKKLGLFSDHAYSFLEMININGQNLVKLRNPWGNTRERFFGCKRWTKQLSQRQNYQNKPKDGSFYMSQREFRKYFGTIEICKLNPNYVHDSIRAKTTQHKSAYFSMRVKKPGKYIVSIYQVNSRKMKKYHDHKYSQARIIILKRQGKQMEYMGSKVTSECQICSTEVLLTEGEYIISAKVVWKLQLSSEMVVTSYGPDHVVIKPENSSIAPDFKKQLIKSYSKLAVKGSILSEKGKIKSYQQYKLNATCQTNFNTETGIGFIRIINESNKGFRLVQQVNGTGLKLIKPDKFPLIIEMEKGPKSQKQKVYGFFVSPSAPFTLSQDIIRL